MGIFRPNYFASDRLLMELVLFESIHKIEMVDAAPSEDNAIITLSIFFVRLSMYAVMGSKCRPDIVLCTLVVCIVVNFF